MSSWAESALRRRDWAEAARRSEDFRRQFPDKPFGYIAAIRALRNDGREAEAETLLFDAIARFPDDEEVRSSRTTLDPSGDQTAAGGAQAGAVLEADEEREEFIVHR